MPSKHRDIPTFCTEIAEVSLTQDILVMRLLVDDELTIEMMARHYRQVKQQTGKLMHKWLLDLRNILPNRLAVDCLMLLKSTDFIPSGPIAVLVESSCPDQWIRLQEYPLELYPRQLFTSESVALNWLHTQ